jgi:dihydroorotase
VSPLAWLCSFIFWEVSRVSEFLLRQGLVMRAGTPEVADVRVVDGTVTEVGSDLASGNADVLECAGAWVGPGFVDLHTHLREPGQEWKEDIETGSAAAAAGGYTAIVAMPNTDPAIDSGHLARYVADRGREVGLVDVIPAGAITEGRSGERLAHLDDLWTAGVRIFSDDGDCVEDAGLLRRAMDYLADLGGVISQHAIDPGLARQGHMHEGHVSSRLGMVGIPSEAETTIVARDIALVELTGCRYHVQHMSAAGSVDLVARAKESGLPVTAEVTPHHLLFAHDAVAATNPAYKMMPPLRSAADREALVEGLRSGAIDIVATDHAPHADHEKDVPFEDAPFGVIGMEWAAAVTNTVADLDPKRFFEVMSVTPASIGQIPRHGSWIEKGVPANIVVFDPVPRAQIARRSRSGNSPFEGVELRGVVRLTMFEGVPTVRGATL